MNKIILIDDDTDFCESFVNIAKTRNIDVATGNNLDDLKNLLPTYSHKFAAVVLDIKGLIDPNQPKENSDFIPVALQYLDTTIPGFKRFLFTGDESEYDKFKNLFKTEKVYIKKPSDQDKLLDELINCIQNFELFKLKRENPVIFDAFDRNLLLASEEPKLLNVLKNYNEKNPLNFTGLIGDIRDLHEGVYKAINTRNTSIVPNRYITTNGSPDFGPLFKHLLGDLDRNFIPRSIVYQDSTISGASKFIKNACSEYLHNTSATNYRITSYTIKALINALMEVIIWSKNC